MTKCDIAKKIAAELGLPVNSVRLIVNRLFDQISDTLVAHGNLELRDFGVFKVRMSGPRVGRNPRNGDTVRIPARCRVKFKPGRGMRERIVEDCADEG